MNSLRHPNYDKHTNLEGFSSGLAYRFLSQDKRILKNLKHSQSVPSLKSPPEPPESSHELPHNTNTRPDPSPPQPTPDQITIRVIDDAHALTKNFICPASLLLTSMVYFRDNLSSYQDNWQEIDISVHCDLQVFSWLMEYVMSSPTRPLPKLDAKRVFSVLVSSEYLGMPNLVDTCIHYISENINAVLAMHASTECLNQLAIDKLASLLTCTQLEKIQDPKDIIQDKLFTSKLKFILDLHDKDGSRPFTLDSVYKCSDCQHYVLPGLESLFLCGSNSAQIRVSKQGSLFYMHRRNPDWSVLQELEELRKQGVSARNRFWRAWSYSQLLFCSLCKYSFIACDVNTCSHFTQNGKLQPSQSSFILVPSLLPSEKQLHCLDGDNAESLSTFEDIMRHKMSEVNAGPNLISDLSVWTSHVFDSSTNQLVKQFNHLFATKPDNYSLHDPPSNTSLSEIQLFSQNAISTSITRNQFFCLREETTPSLPLNPVKHKPPNRSSSRDSNSLKNLKMRPFTGSVNGELEMGTDGDDDEKSEADSRTVCSSLTKSRSNTSQQSLCYDDTKYISSTWNLLHSRKSNIDLQREREYVKHSKMSHCFQNLVLSKHNRHNHQQTNVSISERIDRNFKAGLTSNKLQKYQQITNPKLKRFYPGKQ